MANTILLMKIVNYQIIYRLKYINVSTGSSEIVHIIHFLEFVVVLIPRLL